ncbi:MAG TPA: helix-turn-helix transcriptional regulator [Actinocrinis sp.]|nr:helix-turn-helix transcriptional regulator [Actinocrinis sp.]
MSSDGEIDANEMIARLIARLRIEREACVGLTQAKLASRLGVAANSLREWEAAREFPTLLHLICWSYEFGLRLALVDSERQERHPAIPEAVEPWADQEVRRLAATLRAARNQRSVTQLWLSGLLGISEMTVNRWEKGAGRPRPTALVRWAWALGLSVTLAPL